MIQPRGAAKGENMGYKMNRLLKRFAPDTSGNATVEFVIWLPMVLLAFGLTVDVSMIFHSQSQVLRIVQDANRNASIGRLRTNARGFHTADAFITMIMLDRAGIAPQLPWTAAA